MHHHQLRVSHLWDAMNARLDALDLSEVEIEEIETPKE